ncbi:uric acid degradation bifunctional protein TTL-like isoform X2 [Mercurialis annua]|nr:uric acid degradation bifunctional protein TTL-like isoform X2 [Mercurialis annua]
MMMFEEKDLMACCGSTKFAKEMTLASPFTSPEQAVAAATNIWFNKVDVYGWLEAFASHPQIGQSPSASHTAAEFSKGEQSTALATATGSSSQELSDWNGRYKQKFGFVFLICASGRTTSEILAELKRRYENKPIVELEIAAQEQMRITELRLQKLFSAKSKAVSTSSQCLTEFATKLAADLNSSSGVASQIPTRSRPPITTHVLDISRGCPAAGVEVLLEMWKGIQARPLFGEMNGDGWAFQGRSSTDADGRSGQLMKIVDAVNPGIYRISFNTGKYSPSGFFPYVSIVFEIRESQNTEHFHVPLLFSPFSFTTYRGS